MTRMRFNSNTAHFHICLLGVCLLWCLVGGPAAHAEQLQYPYSIAVDSAGVIYLADRNLPGVFKSQSGSLSVVFQASKKFRTPLNAIRCVEIDGEGRLLAGDSATRDVYRFDGDGEPKPLTRQGETFGQIGIPMDIAVNSRGDIYVTDLEIQRVVKLAADGGQPQEVAEITGCRGLAVDSKDNVWVVSTTNDQLLRISPDGQLQTVVAGRPFEFPHTVVVDDDGVAYVCDGYAKAIWKVVDGQPPEKWVTGEPFQNPVGLARQGDKLLVVDPRAQAVFEIDNKGQLSTVTLNQE